MTSPSEKQTIVICVLPKFSISKFSQTTKFSQLTEYNMRNIFLQKSFTKCGEETISRLFSKILKSSISLDTKKLYTVFFLVWKVEGFRNMLKLSCRPLAFTSYKAFLKNKKRSGTSPPTTSSS